MAYFEVSLSSTNLYKYDALLENNNSSTASATETTTTKHATNFSNTTPSQILIDKMDSFIGKMKASSSPGVRQSVHNQSAFTFPTQKTESWSHVSPSLITPISWKSTPTTPIIVPHSRDTSFSELSISFQFPETVPLSSDKHSEIPRNTEHGKHESRLDFLKHELEDLKAVQHQNAHPTLRLTQNLDQEIEKEVKAIKEAIEIEETFLEKSASQQGSEITRDNKNTQPFGYSEVEEKLQQAIQEMKEKLAEELVEISETTSSVSNKEQTQMPPPLPPRKTGLKESSKSIHPVSDESGTETNSNETTEHTIYKESLKEAEVFTMINKNTPSESDPLNEVTEREKETEIFTAPPTEENEKTAPPLSRSHSSHSVVSESSASSTLSNEKEIEEEPLEVHNNRLMAVKDDLRWRSSSTPTPVLPHIVQTEEEEEEFDKASNHSLPFSPLDRTQPDNTNRSRSSTDNSTFGTPAKQSETESDGERNTTLNSQPVANLNIGENNKQTQEEGFVAMKGSNEDIQSSLSTSQTTKKEKKESKAKLMDKSEVPSQVATVPEPDHIPADVYIPKLSASDASKVSQYFMNGNASFTLLWHKTDEKGKEKPVKVTLEFPGREVCDHHMTLHNPKRKQFFTLTEKKTLGKKVTKWKLSHSVKVYCPS